jgi:hypothetical protein
MSHPDYPKEKTDGFIFQGESLSELEGNHSPQPHKLILHYLSILLILKDYIDGIMIMS